MAAKKAKRAVGRKLMSSVVYLITKGRKAARNFKNSKAGRRMAAMFSMTDPSRDVWISKLEAEHLGLKCASMPNFNGIYVKKDGVDLHMSKIGRSGYVGVERCDQPSLKREKVTFVAQRMPGAHHSEDAVDAALDVASKHGPAVCTGGQPLFHACRYPLMRCTCQGLEPLRVQRLRG